MNNTKTEWMAGLQALLSPQTLLLQDEPLAPRTTMHVGGPADVLVEPADETDLAAALNYCREHNAPLLVMGRGSNLIVRDGGFRGVVICLTHPAFSRIENDGIRLRAGAGVKIREVAAEARRRNLSGLEFLEGIPGSVGGALRMNAGAMGSTTFDVVESIRFMDMEGRVHELNSGEFPVKYRCCPLLEENIALAAVFRGAPTPQVVISEISKMFNGKRWQTQPASPSAGCVFKNPLNIPAGKLIDDLGLKGARAGGAAVSEMHANFIVNEGRATAADILRLVELIRTRAREERGVELELEVQVVGEDLPGAAATEEPQLMTEALNIAVMLGGPSAEREVSLRSGAAVAQALRSLGHRVTEIDPKDGTFSLPAGTDAVVLVLHGTYGEDGTVQRRLEELGVPYTGCDAEASRIGFDKVLTKRKCLEAGVPTARFEILTSPDQPWPEGWQPPVVLKPVRQGSSVGLQFVNHAAEWPAKLAEAFRHDSEVLMEERIFGRETTVGILDGQPLPVVEVRVKQGEFDYQNKYTAGATEHFCPADFDGETTRRIQEAALGAFHAIGGRDYARVDVMVRADGSPVVLEVNTLPGMTELSLLPEAARAAGLDYAGLCGKMVEMAMRRKTKAG